MLQTTSYEVVQWYLQTSSHPWTRCALVATKVGS